MTEITEAKRELSHSQDLGQKSDENISKTVSLISLYTL